jgi:uncharacterized repeat protein (TIGR01451 family)
VLEIVGSLEVHRKDADVNTQAGTYDWHLQIDYKNGAADNIEDNFRIMVNNGHFTIKPRPVTIYVDNASKQWNQDDPTFNGWVQEVQIVGDTSTGGLLPGDDESVLGMSFYRIGKENDTGTYLDIGGTDRYNDVLSATITNTNYIAQVVPGDFEITEVPLTGIVGNVGTSWYYDGLAHTAKIPTHALGDLVVEFSDTQTGPRTTDLPERTLQGRTTFYYWISLKDVPGYSTVSGTGYLTSQARPVTVIVPSGSKYVNEADPASYGSVTIKDGDGTDVPAGITAEVAGIASALTAIRTESGNAVGNYELNIAETAAQLGSTYKNFKFTIVPGNFEIKALEGSLKNATINTAAYYDGYEHGSVATVTDQDDQPISGVTIRYSTTNGGPYTLTEGPKRIDVGTTTLYFEATKEGYATVRGQVSVFVDPRRVFIQVANDEKFYGDPDPTFAPATFIELVVPEDTSSGMTAVPSNLIPELMGIVGSMDVYRINAAANTDADTYEYHLQIAYDDGPIKSVGNFILMFNNGHFTIKKRPLKITLPNAQKPFGTPDPAAFDDATIALAADGSELSQAFLTELEGLSLTVTRPDAQSATGGTLGQHALSIGATAQELNNEPDYANFTFELVPGYLTIVINETGLSVSAPDLSWVYDGYTHYFGSNILYGVPTSVPAGATIRYMDEFGQYTLTESPRVTNVVDTQLVKFQATMEGYAPATGEAMLTITQRPVIIRVDAKSKAYGDPDPTFTGYVEMANEVSSGGLGRGLIGRNDLGAITYSRTNTAEYVGSYRRVLIAAYTANPNYNVMMSPADFTITGDAIIAEKTTPAVTSNYALGETIPFTITVTNRSNMFLTNVEVTDSSAILVPGTGYTIEGTTAILDTIPSGGSVAVNAEHVVTEADILAGTYNNTATITAGSKVITASETTDDIEDATPSLTMEKEIDDTPENGETYALNEVITYKITVINDGNVTINNIDVFDSLSATPNVAIETIASLAPGAEEEVFFNYTVTEADIMAGSIKNSATATGTSADDDDDDDDDEIVEPEDPGEEETGDLDDPTPHMTIAKEITDTPANGTNYVLDEIITYTITVTNDGNVTINGIDVFDSLNVNPDVAIATIASLEPGESDTVEFNYMVTEADIAAGSITNSATASGTSADDDDDDEDDEPVETEEPGENTTDDVEEPAPSFTLEKALTNLPARGTFNAGETATFSITVTNTGNLTLERVTVSELLANATIQAGAGYSVSGSNAIITGLAPGQSVVIQATYTVTFNDLGNTELYNRVAATGEGVYDPTAQDDEVSIPTSDRPAPLNVTGTKQWVDNGPETRPASITVRLLANGVETQSVTVSEADGWAYSFENLPRTTDAGAAITYSVAEDAVPGYDTTYDGYNITNTMQPYTLTINYWYESVGGAPAATTVSRTYGMGQAYNVASPRISGYVANPAAVTGVITGDATFDVVYTRVDYTLTIHYVYQDGSEAAPTHTGTLGIGEMYDIASPVLEGYIATMERVSGEMPGYNMTYTVIYIEEESEDMFLIADYGTPLNIGNVVMNAGECFE